MYSLLKDVLIIKSDGQDIVSFDAFFLEKILHSSSVFSFDNKKSFLSGM